MNIDFSQKTTLAELEALANPPPTPAPTLESIQKKIDELQEQLAQLQDPE